MVVPPLEQEVSMGVRTVEKRYVVNCTKGRERTFELVLPSGGALSDARIGTTRGSHP